MVLFNNFEEIMERIMEEYDLSKTDVEKILDIIEEMGECGECFMGDI